MIRHTVLFRLPRPLDAEAATRLVADLRAFAADAPHAAAEARVVAPLGLRGEGPRAADALLEVHFATPEDFNAYISSPAHQALVADVLEPRLEGWWAAQEEVAAARAS